MILLTVSDITKHYGSTAVLDGVSFDLRRRERVSLVGPNGAGKTTLLKILAGREEAERGSIDLNSDARLGFLEQQPQFAPGQTVWDEARDALRDLIELAHEAQQAADALAAATSTAERVKLGERYDRLQHELHRRGGYHYEHRIERILTGLGFAEESFSQPVVQLSGGQQNRLLLAKLLLAEPEVMLLDEPSNHLDIAATQWLEDFLATSRQALIVVSHDRYFLDKVTTRTLELYHGEIDSFAGNYSAYVRQKADRLETQRRTFEKQQHEIAKMEDFVRRNMYGQKHAQAEDRRKKLARIERVAAPREIAAPPMGLPQAERSGDIVLRVERLAKAYDKPLFANLSFDILRGEKWGVLGPNGSGKTTLLRCLLGREKPDEGNIVLGTGVRLAYFDQLLECVDADSLVIDAVRPQHKEFFEQQRRDLLARFGLIGDMVMQRVGSLSGGERNRTALAMLAASDANLLVLDEPTNHLDLWARGALEASLRKFNGSVLFVSHDRYFLNQAADHLLVFDQGRFRVIEGNYDTYLTLSAAAKAEPLPANATGAGGDSKQKASRAAAPRSKRRFPYRKVSDLEEEIARREGRIEELHAQLTAPEVLRDGDKVKQATAELDQQREKLAVLYDHWEEAIELN